MRYEKWIQKNLTSLVGKTVVITGGNSGIGFASAEIFLFLGARIILACRNLNRAEEAKRRLLSAFPEGSVETEQLDLASFASIDAFSVRMKERNCAPDAFLHCAGVYYPREAFTEDGYPMTEGVNYIGTVRLADAMKSLMNENGRMVFTTSLVDRFGKPNAIPKEEGYDAYSRSKTLLSADVIRRAASRGEKEPMYAAAHPGITATNLLSPDKTTHKPFFSRLGHAFLYMFTHSPEKAALTGALAVAGDVKNGEVVGPRGWFGISGYPHVVRFSPRARKTADGSLVTVLPTANTALSQENEATRCE